MPMNKLIIINKQAFRTAMKMKKSILNKVIITISRIRNNNLMK